MESSQVHQLIIIDDEPLARHAFSHLLADSFPEFELVGEADSGPGGLVLFRKLQPQIIIMDIRIPGFDGLETSRIILRESPDAQIIVLSAYDDFEYVQEALHDGVLGYLLKPVKEEKLKEIFEKAVRQLQDVKTREKSRQLVRTYRSIAVREQVASFIYGRKGGIPAFEFAALSDPPIKSGYFLVLYCKDAATFTVEEIRAINDSLDRMEGCLSGEWMGDYLPVFVSTHTMNNTMNHESWRAEAEFLSREIQHVFRSVTRSKISLAVGPVRHEAAFFGDSFRGAFDALQEDSQTHKLIFADISRNQVSKADSYPVDKEKSFLRATRASDGAKALAAAENLAIELAGPEQSLMDARFAVTEFLIVFRREWERISGEPKRRSMANLLREALLCSDHDVLREWFLLVVRDLIRNLVDSDKGEDLLVRKVRHFIDLNKLSEVSLEAAADSVGITAPYLSRLFKENTGGNFHDYLVDRRLDAAVRLLRETSLSVQEISRQVGYGDVGYFGRIFRNKYGSTPREYRNDVS